jgi:hypothetical protein
LVGFVGEGAEAALVRRRLPDRVQHLHVADVVDDQGLLQADDETLKTEEYFFRLPRLGSEPNSRPTAIC